MKAACKRRIAPAILCEIGRIGIITRERAYEIGRSMNRRPWEVREVLVTLLLRKQVKRVDTSYVLG